MERELKEAVEILPSRLYSAALRASPGDSAQTHYFTVDNQYLYEPFFADFGPLNLGWTCRFCRLLDGKLKDPVLQKKRIIYYSSHDTKKRANAVYLVCAYQVAVMGKTAEQAFEPFRNCYPPFLPFRDATCGVCNYQMTIVDCLKGLEVAIQLGWFDWSRFDIETYEYFEKVEHGDMNWIVPGKFLAFAGPCPTSIDPDGYPAFTPEDYVPIFKDANIGLVVRLNKKQYERDRFTNNGIKHVDLYFVDGSCPSMEIISKFLHITECEPTGIAVHCKAGLGRTGSLIGLYCMKHYQFPARAWIGWNRICRPGSILGPQQQFLLDMQNDMFQAGLMARSRPSAPPRDEVEAVAQQMERLKLRSLTEAERVEDKGQGDRLCNAKRQGLDAGPDRPGFGLGSVHGLSTPLVAREARVNGASTAPPMVPNSSALPPLPPPSSSATRTLMG
eukprot:CAMPEP_0206535368 /NCGR_PEP_ID=MMETSP0325_2-20121206/6092_1 /ASSEMBLY_ACC=CAM_ASM_000347 /TAXON_ID=2866 /ORGANISM="Crypthecodinium cohnii, Strain Seligo" /LENGTH=444 /DNA_ID=CAMNT_0054032335 /DNA_START=93 /DNA_END=1423 /DNA_ORIENTATION=+